MKVLHDLGNEAASPGTNFSRAIFVAGALRELFVGLWRGNCAMYRASAGFLAHVTGRSLRTGMGDKEHHALSKQRVKSTPCQRISPTSACRPGIERHRFD
jgi:hypothetical protein